MIVLRNVLDKITFSLLIVGAFAWAYFITDSNILDLTLEAVWDPLDDLMFILIGLSGFYWLVKALRPRRN